MNLYKYVSKLSFSLVCALCGMSRFSIMFEHYLCYVCFTHDFSVTCKMYLRNKGIEYVCMYVCMSVWTCLKISIYEENTHLKWIKRENNAIWFGIVCTLDSGICKRVI